MAGKARDIMTGGAECVGENETLFDAAKRLARLSVGALPICGEDDRLKGMLTDRDIVVRAVAKGKDVFTTRARELAQGKPVTIGADDSIDEAIDTMRKHQVRRLPVIDGYRLIGVVSQADIARNVNKKQAGALLKAISEENGGSVRRAASTGGRLLTMALPIAGMALLGRKMLSSSSGATVEQSTEVHVPVHTAYNQWTQFEEFPSFMSGVQEVRQIDDTRLHWVAEVGGKRREWDAKITEQVPDSRVAWRSTTGKPNGGTVTFQSLGSDLTRVTVQMDYQPEGMSESVGTALGLAKRRVKGDLDRFREIIESRGSESGAWRGEVHGGQVTNPS